MKLTRAIMLGLMLASTPAWALDKAEIAGKWQCEYAVRDQTKPDRDSAAWFQVTLKQGGKFLGTGKAIAGGSALPMNLRGAWALSDDGVLKLTGVSEVANQQLPFRFVADVIDANSISRLETRGSIHYRTGCDR